MPKADVVNRERQVIGQIDLSEEVFGKKYRPALIHQVVVGYLANQRQGTHSTKTRVEVSGGGKKPFKQKGTGRARQGSIRSPLMRGGGIVFGPKPRDYRTHTPRNMRREAVRSVLSQRLKEGQITLVDEFRIDQPKTRLVAQILKNLQLSGKVLLVLEDYRPDILRAAANIPGLKVTHAGILNTYELSRADNLLVTQAAARKLEEMYQS